MPINFTGIKNTGYFRIIDPINKEDNKIFSTMLTDDYTGEDLSEYRKVVNATGLRYNPLNNTMITLYIKKMHPESDFEKPKYEFFLNATPLEVNDKNLKMFSYLAKTTKKIINKKDNEIIVNKDFLESDDLRYGMIPKFDLVNILKGFKTDYKTCVEYLFNKQSAKEGAKDVNDCIQDAMEQYFA